MKINEIATRRLDEAPPIKPIVNYVGPYFDKAAAAAAKLFGVGKGTTQAELDALRAAETGAVKAAGDRPLSTVSKDELNALLYPPAKPEPTVGSFLKKRGDTGFNPDLSKPQTLPGYLQNLPPARIDITAPPKLKPKADISAADREVRNRHDMNPGMPNKGKPSAEAEAYAAEKAAQDAANRPPERTAVANRPPEPESFIDNEPTLSSNNSNWLTPQADTVTLPRDYADRIMRMAERDPAAAQAAAEKFGIPWKSILAGGATIGALQGGNALYPDTIPSAGQLIDKGVTKLTTFTADPDGAGPPPGERAYDFKTNDSDPKTSEKNSSANTDAPPASNIDDIKDTDAYKKALKQALDGEKIDESTAALNRMIYLSRL